MGMALAPTGQSHEIMNESKRRAESCKPRQSCDGSSSSSSSSSSEEEDLTVANLFRDLLWRKATDDNRLTLYGFRRFRTTHLLNLRFLEEEIDVLDHRIFQAGLRLGYGDGGGGGTCPDKLGLRHGRIDPSAAALGQGEVMSRELVLRMRELIKQYGTFQTLRCEKHVSVLFGTDSGPLICACRRRGFGLF